MQGSARDFLKPKLVDSIELSTNEYRVVLEPFERGFGHTLGNSLRRTLLSSMVGSAITEVLIDGGMHEDTMREVLGLGADECVVCSVIVKSDDPVEKIRSLKKSGITGIENNKYFIKK